jgi:hypothetical protein
MSMLRTLRGLLLATLLLGIGAIPVFAQVSAVPSDKLAWDVRQDPAGLTFQIVIDGQRSSLSGSSCGALESGVSVCSAPLPAMTPGVHTIQIVAALSVAGTSLESAPSAPLSVSFIAVVTPENVRLIKG